MRRRLVIGICAATALSYDADVFGAAVGHAKPYHIGLIGFPRNGGSQQDIFKKAMTALGYVEGKDVIFDFQFADGNLQNFPGLAAALVAANPDVIVAVTTNAAVAAARATATIPIVFTYVSNPTDVGYVASLTHPRHLASLFSSQTTRRIEVRSSSCRAWLEKLVLPCFRRLRAQRKISTWHSPPYPPSMPMF